MSRFIDSRTAVINRLKGGPGQHDDGTPVARHRDAQPEKASPPPPPKPDPITEFAATVARAAQVIAANSGGQNEAIARIEKASEDLRETLQLMMQRSTDFEPEEWEFTWETDFRGNKTGIKAKRIR